MPKGITSLVGFIRKMEDLRRDRSGVLLFRGHSSNEYVATPSVFRNKSHAEFERDMLFDLISESPKEFERDTHAFDRLVRAQHYGVPTRLLDLTSNPLMALYFCCEKNLEDRGQVIVYEVQRRELKFFSSDAVSSKANLALLTEAERVQLNKDISLSIRRVFGPRSKSSSLTERRINDPKKYNEFLEDWNARATPKRLVQFIKEEKPYFENRIDPVDILSIQAVTPKKSNARIIAQSGAFLMFGLRENLSARTAKDIETSVIDIPAGNKRDLLESLAAIGVQENTVYPELDRLASRIKRKFE